MTKTTRRIVSVLALAGLSTLGGCGFMTVSHSTTESRYMTQGEQEFWTDRRCRQDKSVEWANELRRQSAVRMAQNLARHDARARASQTGLRPR